MSEDSAVAADKCRPDGSTRIDSPDTALPCMLCDPALEFRHDLLAPTIHLNVREWAQKNRPSIRTVFGSN